MPLHVKILFYLNLKFDFMFKRLINNTIKDLSTTAIGALAGSSDLIEGVVHKNAVQIIKGISLILLGMFTNSKPTRN